MGFELIGRVLHARIGKDLRRRKLHENKSICGRREVCRHNVPGERRGLKDTHSFLGVILVTRSDSTIHDAEKVELPTRPFLGDIAVLTSAFLCAVNVIYLKVRVGNEDRADMQVLFG